MLGNFLRGDLYITYSYRKYQMFKMNEKHFWNNSSYKYKRCGSSIAKFELWRTILTGDGEAGGAENECTGMLKHVQGHGRVHWIVEDYLFSFLGIILAREDSKLNNKGFLPIRVLNLVYVIWEKQVLNNFKMRYISWWKEMGFLFLLGKEDC